MTKLEELKATAEAAEATYGVALDAARDAAWDAEAAIDDAWGAYYDELKKTQEVMTNSIKYEVRVRTNGDKPWYLNGKRHSEDGPAVW
jgi:hypothetical protein